MRAARTLRKAPRTGETEVEEVPLTPDRGLAQGNHVAEARAVQSHCMILALLTTKVERPGGGQRLQVLYGSAIQVSAEPVGSEGRAPDGGDYGSNTQAEHPLEKGAPGLPPKWSFHVNPCWPSPLDDPAREPADRADVPRDNGRDSLLAELSQGRLIRTRERWTNPDGPERYAEGLGLRANQVERVGLEIHPLWNKRHEFADPEASSACFAERQGRILSPGPQDGRS